MDMSMRSTGYYVSEGEFGFKWLDGYRFAILYIPKGTPIHVSGDAWESLEMRISDPSNKRRAAHAYVANIGRLGIEEKSIQLSNRQPLNCTQYSVSEIESGWSAAGDAIGKHLKYRKESMVRPSLGFTMGVDKACASGIHYFSKPVFSDYAFFFGQDSAQAIRDWFYGLTSPYRGEQIELKIEELAKNERRIYADYIGNTTGKIFVEEVTHNEQ